jgi:hypothetical protein
MGSLIPDHGDASVFIKVVLIVFPAMIDQQVFFFIDKLQNIALTGLEMRSQLNGKSRARLLTESSVNAASEIDPEPPGITAPVRSLGRLHRDTADRAGRRAKIASHAALLAVRVSGEDNDRPRPGG